MTAGSDCVKKVINATSVLSLVLALTALVTGVRVMTGHGFFVGIAFFSMTRNGTVMGFFGNILSIALTVMGFGAMGLYGLDMSIRRKHSKEAFIWGCVMTALCLLSLVCSLIGRSFNMGDIMLLLLPCVHTFCIMKSA
jgi:hypothetical protein